MNYNVIVGGGIAGITTAFLLIKQGLKVILIEKEDALGGLLKSKNHQGHYFDYGTHIVSETGIPDLDNFFFKGMDFNVFRFLKYGNFHHKLYDKNGFLTDFALSEQDRYNCFTELLEVSKNQQNKKYSNLEVQLRNEFGNQYYEQLFFPVIKKLFSVEANRLTPDAHRLFGLSRIISGTPQETRVFKKKPYLDVKLAFHSYTEGKSSLKSFYPSYNGMGEWIKFLEVKLLKLGVRIIKNANFSFMHNEKKITTLQVLDEKLAVDKLYWTIPPIFLYKSLNLKLPNLQIPKRLNSIIVDVLLESGEYQTDLYYFQVYDPTFESFRITLYDNYSKTGSKKKRITVEFLSESLRNDTSIYGEIAIKELREMKVVSDNSTLTCLNIGVVKGGFPVPTVDFTEQSERITKELESFKNVFFFGRSIGKVWFMNEVIHNIHESLEVL